MEKITFVAILQSSLLSFDGVSEQDIIEKYGLNSGLAKLGVELSNYLKKKEVN